MALDSKPNPNAPAKPLPVAPRIDFIHPQYRDMQDRWKLIRDCIEGAHTVKAEGDRYLPRPNATDTSAANRARFDALLKRAVFYNVTGRSLNGLAGLVTSEDPVTIVPDTLAPMIDNVNGVGGSLRLELERSLRTNIAYGRAGLMVDFPVTEGEVTRAQLVSGTVRPVITVIDPWDIINWRTCSTASGEVVTLVVLQESYVSEDDGFAFETAIQFRELRCDQSTGGVCVVRVWQMKNGVYEVHTEHQPRDFNGNPLTFLPFVFLGADGNTTEVDVPPLLDIADLNIAHYRNSADHEESCYIIGQPTPVFSGLTKEWVDEVLRGRVELGSRAAVMLPQGASAQLLQAAENNAVSAAMEHKEKQMVELGAKLIREGAVARTATEAELENSAETSVLATIANNTSSGWDAAMRIALGFVQALPSDSTETKSLGIQILLNTNFNSNRLDAQSLQQLTALWQTGGITDEEFRNLLTRAGFATEDFEDWKDAREKNALNPNITTIADLMRQPAAGGSETRRPAAGAAE